VKFSIITPVLNSADTLETTILSVITQNVDAEIEYIVIDGGSTDGTLAILETYSAHIDILISEPDLGIYDAMNKGIANATGDIIGIVNSDDWYTPNAFSELLKASERHPESSIFYSSIDNYLNGKLYDRFLPGNLDNLPIAFVLNHAGCFVKREVYDTIGHFNTRYSIVADYDFFLRAYNVGLKFHYIETPLACYSLNGMSSKVFNRFCMLFESWLVTAAFAATNSASLEQRRNAYYLKALVKELIIFPVKSTLGANRSRLLRNLIMSKLRSSRARNPQCGYPFGKW